VLFKSAQQQGQMHLFKTVVMQRLNWTIEAQRKQLRSAKSALIIVAGSSFSVLGWFRYARLQRSYKVTFLENMNDLGCLLEAQFLSQFGLIEVFASEQANVKLVNQLRQLEDLSPVTVAQSSTVSSFLHQNRQEANSERSTISS
jgi:rRNA processing protein Krr1/Pno1